MDLEWAQDLDSWFPDRDQSYVPIWGASWSDYSGFGWVVILEKDNQLYELRHGYSPMYEGMRDLPEWAPALISYEEAIATMIDWEPWETGVR